MDDDASITPSVPRGGVAGRVLAGIAGVIVLAVAATVTLGMAIIAALAMGAGAGLATWRGRQLTRSGSWGWATGGAVITILCLGVIFYARLPAEAVARIRHAADSASTAPQKPPPVWITKVSPGTSAAESQALGTSLAHSPAFRMGTTMLGIAFGAGFLGGFAGTLGWCIGMLLGYAFVGRWPGGDYSTEPDGALAADVSLWH